VAVCYDLRFPELFRQMLATGLDLLAVPAAFTVATGRAHWELLLRARAVENLSYVVAAAQFGEHPGNRETWGHSMIVDPWGLVLADAGTTAGLVVADMDREKQRRLRREFPVLEHRRDRAN
jgi:nitrilase